MKVYDSVEHFSHLFESCKGKHRYDGVPDRDIGEWQAEFRVDLRDILGLSAMERDLAGHTPVAEMSASIDMGSYTREEWRIGTEPTVPLPFYVLRPKNATVPVPLVLTPHGHNHPYIYVGLFRDDAEKEKIAEGERDIAVQAVDHGYLAIAPTTRAFGETRTEEDALKDVTHSCRTQLMHDLLVGRTPIGDRVWDISRLIDWAIKTQKVDQSRIAITGNSGGGTVSLYAAACDERISAAVPSCYFNTFAGSIGTMHHCDCNYVPGILRLGEMYDVAGLIAPRHFLAVAGREDPIFPLEHVKYAFERLSAIYEAAGAGSRCELYVGDGGHRYYKERVWSFLASAFARAAD